MKYLTSFLMGALMIMALDMVWANKSYAQGTQYTYCEGPNGQVVIVSNFTCPPGFWRI
jgi:hypothetical protein